LYVNDSPRAQVKVFDVAADGSLSNGRILLDSIGGGTIAEGSVDGMECDALGNVWTTGPGGLWVISPKGEHIGTVPMPEVAGSLVWCGDDLHTLFVCTSTTCHAIETRVAGLPLAFAG
jgi:gluconolactonase